MSTRSRYTASTAIILIASALSFAFLDRETALFFHALDTPPWHDVFDTITRFGQSEWYLVPGLFLFVIFRNSRPPLSWTGLFVFAVTAVSGIAANIVKFILGRARPGLFFHEGIYGLDWFNAAHAWTSFPSGHSATAFSVAAALVLLYPGTAPLFYGAAAIIAFSRIFLGQHYLSDVIAGSFLGIATSIFLYHRYFKQRIHAPQELKP
jgi:membrane-associated phospholipid phosphatase